MDPTPLPQPVKNIRARFLQQFPLPQGDPSPEQEDRCRQWSIRLAEQVAFELPGQGWGIKRADQGRPIGKDTIAREFQGALLCWDLMTGAGTGRPTLNDSPMSEDITGQFFETRSEFFKPANHLGVVIGGPSSHELQPPAGGISQADLEAAVADVLKALTDLDAANERRHQALLARLDQLRTP